MCSEPETTFGFLSFYLNIKDVCGCENILNVHTVVCSSSEGCGSVGFYADYLGCTSELRYNILYSLKHIVYLIHFHFITQSANKEVY